MFQRTRARDRAVELRHSKPLLSLLYTKLMTDRNRMAHLLPHYSTMAHSLWWVWRTYSVTTAPWCTLSGENGAPTSLQHHGALPLVSMAHLLPYYCTMVHSLWWVWRTYFITTAPWRPPSGYYGSPTPSPQYPLWHYYSTMAHSLWWVWRTYCPITVPWRIPSGEYGAPTPSLKYHGAHPLVSMAHLVLNYSTMAHSLWWAVWRSYSLNTAPWRSPSREYNAPSHYNSHGALLPTRIKLWSDFFRVWRQSGEEKMQRKRTICNRSLAEVWR